MKVFAKTDTGMVRQINEDYYYISENENIYILADGMGGYKGGEIASKIAVETAKNYIYNNLQELEKEKTNLLDLIKEAIEYANMMVYEKAQSEEELSEMGTTLDVLMVRDNKMYIGHVGDSRIYNIKNNTIQKVTNDHSYVEKLIKDGKITREEAKTHPDKNMLIKAIGSNTFVVPDLIEETWKKDDIILMCSDGLSNMVKEDEILKIITQKVNTKAEVLIETANEQGGLDNITVILIENN